MLKGKKIILGVTGSIAAYKAAILIRLLVKEGAEVKIIMTSLAKQFITPLTLATLSKNPILVDFFNPENGEWNSHVKLGEWADCYLIAPVTANTIGKMAHGIADNLLLTTYLSARCPVFVSPAMDLDMYNHPTTKANLEILESHGVKIIEPASGELASGLTGKGRMEEPEKIVEAIKFFFSAKRELEGKKIVVTAGATIEKIDPVRYISNYSTGKMGYAIADELCGRGAEVTLISGAASATIQNKNINIIKVESAEEMFEACKGLYPKSDGAVFAAAVADYTPENPEKIKIKKKEDSFSIQLRKNKDIALEMGKIKKSEQINVGFALETNDQEANAKEKLAKKNFDFVIMNSLTDKGAGFGVDTNKITVYRNDGTSRQYELKTKSEVARDIVDEMSEYFKKH